MKFECFVCFEKFDDANIAISHLQKEHKIKEKLTELKGLVNFALCEKTYLTFSGPRKHMKNCSPTDFGATREFPEVNTDFILYT